MVRETRHLWVGNLPDNIREERILEHFKRHGKVQSVKILAKKDEEDSNGVCATVAFIDIKSAAKAHNAENKIEERTLKTDYYEPPASSTASSAIFIHERDDTLGRPAGTPYSAARSARLQEERSYERTGYYYDRTGDRDTYMRRSMGLGYHDDDNYPVRGRSRDRYIRSATTGNVYQDGAESRNQSHFRGHNNNRQHFEQQRYPSAEQYSEDRESSSSGGRTTRRPSVTASTVSATVSSPTHNSNSGTNRQRRPKRRSPEQSRSGSRSNSQSRSRSSSRSSNGSRSSSASSKLQSSSSNESSRSRSPSKSRSPAASHGSQSSGKSGRVDRPASTITAPSTGSFLPSAVATPTLSNCTLSSQTANLLTSLLPLIENSSDKDDKRPLGICVRNLPVRSTDTSLKDGLFHEYKKHGKVTMVKVIGQGTDRYAVVCFKKPEDVEKALEVSKDKLFFGCKIEVTAHEGLDGEDNEFRPLEADLDEYHPKATRTLFIGNLEKDITTTELKKHFEQFGEIIEIDIKKQGSASSYAFIQYSDIASVVKAMRKLDGENLGTNRIKLGFGKSMPTNCVWLDGIVDTFPEKLLTRHFNRFGPVNYTVIDRERGHALIFYDTTEFAQIAVSEMRGRMLVGKRLQVDYASRECQQAFFEKMEMTGQMLPGDRPWERRERREFEVIRDERFSREPRAGFENRTYARYETQTRTARANFRGVQRGTFPNRGRGQTFPGRYEMYHDEFVERRLRNYDEEFSQGSGASFEDSYEQELREYGFSQRERREYSSEERGVRGKSFSPLRRRDTNSASPPPRERLKDEHSNSPHFRNDRGAVRNEKHPEHYIGKDRFPITREDGIEEVITFEERDRCKVGEGVERQSRKKLKHQFNVSDQESQHSQSPTRSRHHSQSLSPLSKDGKSSKDQERLGFHLKSPSSHNSSMVNSPTRENSFEVEHPGNIAGNVNEILELEIKPNHKEFSLESSSTESNTLKFHSDGKAENVELSKRKSAESRCLDDFLSTSGNVSEHLERKRKLLDPTDGHYVNSISDDIHNKSDDLSHSDSVNNKIKTDSPWQDSLDKTAINISMQDGNSSIESCEMQKKEIPPTEVKYFQDKQYRLMHLLEQLGEGVTTSDIENSIDSEKPCKKKQKLSDLNSVLDVCEMNAKDITNSLLKENAKESRLYQFLHPSRTSSHISFGDAGNLLPKLQESSLFRKQSDPRKSAELLSSHYLAQKLKKHSLEKLESTQSEDDVIESLTDKDDSTNIVHSWRKLGNALGCKDDMLLDVSSAKETEHSVRDVTHHSDASVYCKPSKDMTLLRPLADNTTSLIHELKKERDMSPLSLPLPKFAAALRTPKASPNPLLSPRPNSVSPKGSTSPKPVQPLKISVPGSDETKMETQFGSDSSCDKHLKLNHTSDAKNPVLVSDISSPQMSPKALQKEDSEISPDSDCTPSPLVNRPSIEERIRALDEKYNAWSGSTRSFSSSISSESPTTPTVDYQKYTIKRRSRYDFLTQEFRTEPSDIMKSLLAKSTIFDQDSKRLEHINEKYEPKEVKVESPKVRPFVRTKAEAKEFSPIQSQVNSMQPFPHNAATVSTSPAHNTSSSSSVLISSVTQSSQFSGSSRAPVLQPSKTSSDNCSAPILQKPNSVQQNLLSISCVKPLDNGKIQPSLHKDDICPPVLTSIKSSNSSVYSALSASLPPLASIAFPAIKKEVLSPTRDWECTSKKEAKDNTRDGNEHFVVTKELPVKKESVPNHLKEFPAKKEYSSKDSHHRKDSNTTQKNHPIKKEDGISKEINHVRKDSFSEIKEIKNEMLSSEMDCANSNMKRRMSSLDSSESDSGKSAKCDSIRETCESSRQIDPRDAKSLEPEPKKPKIQQMLREGEKDRHRERSSSPPLLIKKSDKREKLQKHKHVRSESYTEKEEVDSRSLSKSSEQRSKSKSDFVKLKDEKHLKTKERKESGKTESKSKISSKSVDNKHSDKEGKPNHGSSSKQKRDQGDREKSKSDKKSGSKSKKESSKKNRSKSDSSKYSNFFDDEPVYFSMYDKVKARSSQNQTLKDQAKDLESVRQKFSQLKQSRAKREEKSKSADQDSDRDSDTFSLHSSDSDSKSKTQSKMKHMKKKKLIIESSSDEAQSRSVSLEDSNRKIFKDSSGSLSDSEAELQALISSSKMKTKKPEIYDMDSSDMEEASAPRYTVRKKLKMKPSTEKLTKQKLVKSDDSSDNEPSFNKFHTKKEHKKKKSKKEKEKAVEHKSNSEASEGEISKKEFTKKSSKPMKKESIKQDLHSPQEPKSHHEYMKIDMHSLEHDEVSEKPSAESKDSSQKQKSCGKKKKKSKKASKTKDRKSHKSTDGHHSSKDSIEKQMIGNSEQFLGSKEHAQQKSLSPPCLQNSLLSDSEFKTDFSDYDFENHRSAEPSRITDFWPATKAKVEFDSEPCHYDSSSALSPVKDDSDAGKMPVDTLTFVEKNLPQFTLDDPLDVAHGSDIPLPSIEPNSPSDGGGLVIDTDRDLCENFSDTKKSSREYFEGSCSRTKDDYSRKSKKSSKDKWKHGKESNIQLFQKNSPLSEPEPMSTNFFDKIISPADEDSKLSEDMRLDEEIAEEARRLEEELLANTDETTTFGESEICKKDEKIQERRFDVEAAEETRRLEEELFSTTQQHWHLKEEKNYCDDSDTNHGVNNTFDKENKNSNSDLDMKGDLYSSLVISSPTDIGEGQHSNEPFLLSDVQDQFKSIPSSYDVDNERKIEDDLAVSALLQEMNNDLPPELPKESAYLDPLIDDNPEDLSYLLAEENSQPLQADSPPRDINSCVVEDFKSADPSLFSNTINTAEYESHSVFDLPKVTSTEVLDDFHFSVSHPAVPENSVTEQVDSVLDEIEAIPTETVIPLLEQNSDPGHVESKKNKKKKKKDKNNKVEKKEPSLPEVEKNTSPELNNTATHDTCAPNLNVMDEDTVEDTSPPVLQPLGAPEQFSSLTALDKLQPLSVQDGFPSLDLANDTQTTHSERCESYSLRIEDNHKPDVNFQLSESNLSHFMPQPDVMSNSSPTGDQASDETEIEAYYSENNENAESSPVGQLLQEYPEISNNPSEAKDISEVDGNPNDITECKNNENLHSPTAVVPSNDDIPSEQPTPNDKQPESEELSPSHELPKYSPEPEPPREPTPPPLEPKEPKRKTERTRRGRRVKTRRYSELKSNSEHQIPLRSSSRRGRSAVTERVSRRSLRSDPHALLLSPADTNQESSTVDKTESEQGFNDNDSDTNRDTSSELNSSKTDTSLLDETDPAGGGILKVDFEDGTIESNMDSHRVDEPKSRRRGRKKKASDHHPSYMSPPTLSHVAEKSDLKDDCEPTKESHRTKESRLWQSAQHDKAVEQKQSKNSSSVYDVFEFRDSEDEELTFERDIQSSSKDRLLDTCRTSSLPHDQKHVETKNTEVVPPVPSSHEKEKKHEDKHKSHEEKETVTKEYVTELSQHGKISITIRLHQRDGSDGSGASTAEVVKTSEAVCEEQKGDHSRSEKGNSKQELSLTDNPPIAAGRQTRKSSRLTAQANKNTMDEVIEDVVKGNFKNPETVAQEAPPSRPTRRTRASRRSEEIAARQLEELSSDATMQDDSKGKTEPIFIIPDNKVKELASEPTSKLPVCQTPVENPVAENETPKPETRISLRYYRIARTTPRNETVKENIPASVTGNLNSASSNQDSNKTTGEDNTGVVTTVSDSSLPCPPLPVMKVEIPKMSSVQNISKESKDIVTVKVTGGLHKDIDDDSDSRSSPTVLIDPVTGFLTPVNKKGEPKDSHELLKIARPGVVVSDTTTLDKQNLSALKTISTVPNTQTLTTVSSGSVKAPTVPVTSQSTKSDLQKELVKPAEDVVPSTTTTVLPVTTVSTTTAVVTTGTTTVISSTTSVHIVPPVPPSTKGHVSPVISQGPIEAERQRSGDSGGDDKEKPVENNHVSKGVVVTSSHASQQNVLPPTVTGHCSIVTTSTVTTTPAALPTVCPATTSSSKFLPPVGQPQVPLAQPVCGWGQIQSPYHAFTPHVISSSGHISKTTKSSTLTQPVVCHSGVRVMTTASSSGASHLHLPSGISEVSAKHPAVVPDLSPVVSVASSVPSYSHSSESNVISTASVSKEHTTKAPSSHYPGHLVISSASGAPVIKTELPEMATSHRPSSKTPPSTRGHGESRHHQHGSSSMHIKHEQRSSSCMSKNSPHVQVTKHSPTFLTQSGFPLSAYEASVNAGGATSGGVIAELLQNPHLLQQHKDYIAVAAAAASSQFAERASSQIIRPPSNPASAVHSDITARLGNPTPPHTPTPPVTSATHLLQSPDLHSAHMTASLHLRHQGQGPLLVSPHLGIHASELNAYVHQQMMYVAAHPHYAAMHPEIRAQHEAQVRAAAAMGMTPRFAYPPMAAAATPPSNFRQPGEPRLPHPTAAETKTDLKPSVEPAKVPADRLGEDRLHGHKSMKQDIGKERKGDSKRSGETDMDRTQTAVDGKHVGPGPPMTSTLRPPQGPYPTPVRQLSPHISVSPHERITDSPAVATLYGQSQLRVGVSHHPGRPDEHKMELSRPQPLKVDDSDRDMKPPLAHQNPPSTAISMYGFDAASHKVTERVSHAGGVLALKKEAISSSHLPSSQTLSAVVIDAHNIPENSQKSMLHSKNFLHHSAGVSLGSLNLGSASLAMPSAFTGIGSQSLAVSASESRRGSIPTPQTGSEAPIHQPSPARAILQSAGIPRTQPQTPPHASQVPAQGDSLLLQRYPVMWQGLLALKNDQAAVQMHFVSGNPRIAQLSLPVMSDGGTPPVRIAQRMRLEQTQLEGVARKMQLVDEHCILLALPCGRDHMDVLQQSNNLRNGFISYLQLKQAAGIVNAAAPGSQQPAYVIHIFPSCEFSDENMARIAPDLLHSVNDIAHLLIIIATV